MNEDRYPPERDLVWKALEKHRERAAEIGGCSDGFCMVTGKKPRGTMVTNGGCRCLNDPHKARRLAMSMHELHQTLLTTFDLPR